MKNTELTTFRNNRIAAIKDSRKVATFIRVVSGKKLPDPLQIYELVLQKTKLPACLLESAIHKSELGRYTYLCLFGEPFCIMREIKSLKSLKRRLRDISPLPHEFLPYVGGAIGGFNHEVVCHVERTVKPHQVDPFNLPMVALYAFHCVIVLDHQTNTLYYVANVPVSYGEARGYEEGCCLVEEMERYVSGSAQTHGTPDIAEMENLKSNLSKTEFMAMVEKAKEHINRGNVFQVVLSRRLSVPFKGNGMSLYRTLRSINPSPYLFHMRTDRNCDNAILLGSSPEIMADIRNRKMVIRPLAGTRKRGKTPAGDKRNEKALLNNPKERAEHKMLVDLALNDMSKFCLADSVVVTELMQAEYCGSVIHMASDVRGKLQDGVDPLDAFFGATPAGTLSGCPKVRALQIITELEPCQRGPYGGAFGWFTDLSLYTCIFIRSALLLDGMLYWQTGAGIVYDSNPEAEYFETEKKSASIKRALLLMQKHSERPTMKKRKINAIRVVVVDHFDSFTYNMVRRLRLLGVKVCVVRTDVSIAEVVKFRPTHIVLSAGEGDPKDVTLFHEVLGHFKALVPIFGICLGHQVIGLYFGAEIARCEKIMHGKTSVVYHNREGIFSGIKNGLQVMRYHSLVIVKESIPPGTLRQTARTADGTVMAIESVEYPHIIGVQFHPESWFTEYGAEMFTNFLSLEVKK